MEQPLQTLRLGRVCWILGVGCGSGWRVPSDDALNRHDLTDAEWALLEPLLPDRSPQRGGRWCDHRLVIDGVFWRTRTGARWSGDGTWERILDGLRTGCDTGGGAQWTVSVDATVARAHQHAAGARHQPPKDIPADRLRPVLDDPPAAVAGENHTGGRVE
jgi:transposase